MRANKILLIMLVIIHFSCVEKETDMAHLVERGGLVYEINQEAPYTGKIFEKIDKGQIVLSGQFFKGKRDGEWIEFFPNGQKWKIIHFDKGALNGEQISYDEAGQLIARTKFIN